MSETDFRHIFFYEIKLDCSAAETTRNNKEVWGERSVGESTVPTWLRKLRSGDFKLEDKEGLGHPDKLDDDELKVLVEANTPTAVRELAEPHDVGT